MESFVSITSIISLHFNFETQRVATCIFETATSDLHQRSLTVARTVEA